MNKSNLFSMQSGMNLKNQKCHIKQLMKGEEYGAKIKFQRCYYIPSKEIQLTNELKYKHSLLYFSVAFNRIDYVEMFLRYNTSPFYYAYEG